MKQLSLIVIAMTASTDLSATGELDQELVPTYVHEKIQAVLHKARELPYALNEEVEFTLGEGEGVTFRVR